MRTRLFALLACLALVTPPAEASESLVGSIVSAGASVNNRNTAVPFLLTPGQHYSLQCDADVYIEYGSTSLTAATSTGQRLNTPGIYDFWPEQGLTVIAILPVAGAATNCRVRKVWP